MRRSFLFYRITLFIIISLVLICLLLGVMLKVNLDKQKLSNKMISVEKNVIDKEDRFLQFKEELLREGIVLDNVVNENDSIKFNIFPQSNLEQLNNLIKILSKDTGVNINKFDINKRNFIYEVNILAEFN